MWRGIFGEECGFLGRWCCTTKTDELQCRARETANETRTTCNGGYAPGTATGSTKLPSANLTASKSPTATRGNCFTSNHSPTPKRVRQELSSTDQLAGVECQLVGFLARRKATDNTGIRAEPPPDGVLLLPCKSPVLSSRRDSAVHRSLDGRSDRVCDGGGLYGFRLTTP